MHDSWKKIIETLDFIKIKNFHSAKDNVKGIRRQVTDLEKKLANNTSKNDCYPKYTKNS